MNYFSSKKLYVASLLLLSVSISSGNESGSLLLHCSPQNPDLSTCPSDAKCADLGMECLSCMCPVDCIYGQTSNAVCVPYKELNCTGDTELNVTFSCRYCYQTDPKDYACNVNFECQSSGDPTKQNHRTNCTVRDDIVCLGRRNFLKQVKCNWTGGYKWSTALILSITLGGFGADRFYLGHWREGIGKLFSFGGLGVWTLVDVVLIGIRYIGPADGSVYI